MTGPMSLQESVLCASLILAGFCANYYLSRRRSASCLQEPQDYLVICSGRHRPPDFHFDSSLLENNCISCPVSRRLKLKGWHWCLEPRGITIVPVVALYCEKEFIRYLRVASKVLEEL